MPGRLLGTAAEIHLAVSPHASDSASARAAVCPPCLSGPRFNQSLPRSRILWLALGVYIYFSFSGHLAPTRALGCPPDLFMPRVSRPVPMQYRVRALFLGLWIPGPGATVCTMLLRIVLWFATRSRPRTTLVLGFSRSCSELSLGPGSSGVSSVSA